MRALIPGLGSDVKHKIDFSLAPAGVAIIEISVLTTQLSKDNYKSLSGLLTLRILHTILMMTFSILLSHLFIRLKRTELNYRTIAITGVLTIALGDIFHRYLGHKFGVELIGGQRRIGIILLQGAFWFPAFLIIGSKRTEIFDHFKKYEEKLIFATRARSRTSEEFAHIRSGLQNQIKLELSASCSALKDSISEITISMENLPESNVAVQRHLHGEELRKLSMKLDTFGSEDTGKIFFGQNLKSVDLLIKQFRILYSSTARSTPLQPATYAIVLMALITPAYINYFTLDESLISYPLIVLSALIAGHLITKTMGGNSLHSQRNSSVLIYLTGFIPFLANITGQAITHNPATQYPFLITLVTLPLTYYIFMKVLQVLQPRSLEHILDGNFEASDALQEAVTKIVSDEFAHTLSHRWAIYIHGKILTRLAATALKLETATNSGDAPSFKKGVDSLVLLLSDPDSEFEQLPTDLETEVHSRLNPWLGLLNVELEIDQDLKVLKNSRVSEFGEVIEELISNSMRHGKSQNISLKVTRVGEKDLHIYAVDDASIAPPESQIRYGLGTRIFNLASDGRWSITRVASSTEFQLTMEIEV